MNWDLNMRKKIIIKALLCLIVLFLLISTNISLCEDDIKPMINDGECKFFNREFRNELNIYSSSEIFSRDEDLVISELYRVDNPMSKRHLFKKKSCIKSKLYGSGHI